MITPRLLHTHNMIADAGECWACMPIPHAAGLRQMGGWRMGATQDGMHVGCMRVLLTCMLWGPGRLGHQTACGCGYHESVLAA